jgi:hypothetical protein
MDGITNQRMFLLLGLPEVSWKGIRESLPLSSVLFRWTPAQRTVIHLEMVHIRSKSVVRLRKIHIGDEQTWLMGLNDLLLV